MGNKFYTKLGMSCLATTYPAYRCKVSCPTFELYNSQALPFASFDTEAQLLVPLELPVDSGIPYYFSNSPRPSSIHATANGFEITISGITSYGPEDSWCNKCEELNRTLYYGRAPLEKGGNFWYVTTYSLMWGRTILGYNRHRDLVIRNAAEAYSINENRSEGYYDPVDAYGPPPIYPVYLPYDATGFVNLIDMRLCNYSDYKEVCGYHSLIIDIGLGVPSGSIYDSNIAPSGENYIYYYKNKEIENRSPVYIIAFTTLQAHNTNLGNAYYSDDYTNTHVGYTPAFFRTVIGEYTGDYIVSSGVVREIDNFLWLNSHTSGILPIHFNGECYQIKPDHGNLDGRSLSFDILGSHRVSNSSIYSDYSSYLAYGVHEDFSLCNFDNMIITVRPLDLPTNYDFHGHPAKIQTNDSYYEKTIGYNDSDGRNLVTFSGLYIKGYGLVWDMLYPVYDPYTETYSNQCQPFQSGLLPIDNTSQAGLGSLGKTMKVTINGFKSRAINELRQHYPSAGLYGYGYLEKEYCSEGHRLNGEHYLHMDCLRKDVYANQFYVERDGAVLGPRRYYLYNKIFAPSEYICCDCKIQGTPQNAYDSLWRRYSSPCIPRLDVLFHIDPIDSSTILSVFLGPAWLNISPDDYNIYSMYAVCNPQYLAVHENAFANIASRFSVNFANSGNALDFNNMDTLTLHLDYCDPIQSGIYDLNNTTVLVDIIPPQEIACAPEPKLCHVCYGGSGPEYYEIEIPNDMWEPNPDWFGQSLSNYEQPRDIGGTYVVERAANFDNVWYKDGAVWGEWYGYHGCLWVFGDPEDYNYSSTGDRLQLSYAPLYIYNDKNNAAFIKVWQVLNRISGGSYQFLVMNGNFRLIGDLFPYAGNKVRFLSVNNTLQYYTDCYCNTSVVYERYYSDAYNQPPPYILKSGLTCNIRAI